MAHPDDVFRGNQQLLSLPVAIVWEMLTLNNIQPGPVDIDMNPASGDLAKMLIPLMGLPRYGSGDETASLVAYLAGSVTGAGLTIDGGFTA
jgi:3-oxoacyl-[acyl-carrier protein] reductase